MGNHWSDFSGYDADEDGIGDIPYELADLFSTLTDEEPELRFFDETPAAEAIDLAGHMFPAFRPRPKVTDTAPLIEVPAIPVPLAVGEKSSDWTTVVAAGAMFALAGGLLLMARLPQRRPG